MNIKHDYSYVSSKAKELIERGYGEMSVYSLHFDRYYTEEQKQQNVKTAESMTNDEWNKHCDIMAESFDRPLREILNVFINKYNIHQVSEETSTTEHYRSDWDLFFWSNQGWNGKDYMDCFSLNFNKKRKASVNMNMLQDVITLLEEVDYKNISCRIQYDAVIDENKVNEEAMTICDKLVGKFIEYAGMVGKIKVVSESDGNRKYGFFKKNARNKYYSVSGIEILTIQQCL